MRKEIHEALQRINEILDQGLARAAANTASSSDLTASDEQYMQTISAPHHQHAKSVYAQLAGCLNVHAPMLHTKPYSSSSMKITATASTHDSVIIDITPFGAFVAVSTYGVVDVQVMQQIECCLQRCGLWQITRQEIDELHAAGQYYSLF